MSIQPDFQHPELVSYQIPTTKWEFVKSNNVLGKILLNFSSATGSRTVVLNEANEKLRESIVHDADTLIEIEYGKDYTTETFRKPISSQSSSRCYQRKIWPSGEKREKWFDMNGNVLASRRTNVKGNLSDYSENPDSVIDSDKPAVVISRPRYQREEFWNDGVLRRVYLIANSKIVVVQEWNNGKCETQFIEPKYKCRAGEACGGACFFLRQDLALPIEAPLTEKTPIEAPLVRKTRNEAPRPETHFKLISAEQARNELLEDDKVIQNLLDDFETRRKANIDFGLRKFTLHMEPNLKERVSRIFERAGYVVRSEGDSFEVEF